MATSIGDIVGGMQPVIEGGSTGNSSNTVAKTTVKSNSPKSTTPPAPVAAAAGTAPASKDFAPKLNSYDKQADTFSGINLLEMIREYENPLLKYHQFTYHFKLYALGPDDLAAFVENDVSGATKEIIAETGVTGRYSINSVQIKGVSPGTPGITSNHCINSFSIELVEQNGMHLYDDLIMMSNMLGYKQFADVPLILELDFIGYEQDSGIPTVIEGQNKQWCLYINSITTTTDKAGGTMHHTIVATNATTVARDDMWTLKEPLEMTVGTFGEGVDQLHRKLQDMSEMQYGYLKSMLPAFADQKYYEFFMDSELRSLQMQGSSSQDASADKGPGGSGGVKKFAWKANTTLATIIDDLLDACFPVQPKDGEGEAPIRVSVNVAPISIYGGFNSILQKHAFKYKIFIVKYKIGDIVSIRDMDESRFSLEYFHRNAEKITDPKTNSPKLNAKVYYYQFSSLNTEIVDLDIKFDNQFNIAISRNPEGMRDASNSAGTHAADATVTYGDAVYTPGNNASFQDMWTAKTKLEQESRDGKRVLTEEDQQFIRDANNVQKPMTEGESEQVDLSVKPPSALDNYLEDYRETYDLTESGTNGIGNTRAPAGERIKGIPMENMNSQNNNSGSVNNSEDPSDQERRLAKDNYYNRSFMAVASLRVQGDPFWLGYGDYSYVQYLKDITSGNSMKLQNNDADFANFITTESYFVLVLKPVVAISDNTGIMDYSEPSTFAESLYRINSITHDFSGGKFQQSVEAALVLRVLNKTDTDSGNQMSGARTTGVPASQSSITK